MTACTATTGPAAQCPHRADGWNYDMSTAPKDGSWLLAASDAWFGDVMIVGWHFGAWRDGATEQSPALEPTRWMPIPDALGACTERAPSADDGPNSHDGCDSDGFLGGCVRMGHTPDTCPHRAAPTAAEAAKVLLATDDLFDALCLCDGEAAEIANRISGKRGERPHCPDGVQVLEDAATIMRAALRALAGEVQP